KIVLVVPDEAEEGFVTLKTRNQSIVSKTVLSFEVMIAINSITPEARPGDNITISGNYVNWIREVRFAENLVVTEFVSVSLNELVVTVPQEAKTGPLGFLTGGTKPLELRTLGDFTVTLPAITGMAPNPVERSGELTITGTDLDLVMGILFKG